MKNLIMKMMGQYLNLLALVAPQYAGKVGLALFCRPFRIKITARHKQFLQSAKQSTFTHGTETITAYAWGDGDKKVLLLHGWQSHTYRWKPYVEQLLQEGYTVYAFDAPGHGLSTGNFLSVPLYSEVIEKMLTRIGKPDAIVSHSIGGFATLYALHHNPSLSSDKLVIMAAPGEATEFFDFYKSSLGLSERSMILTILHFTEQFKHSPAYFSTPNFASSLAIPGLIIHDEEDEETSVQHANRMHQRWNKSKLMITKGLGHNLKSSEIVYEVVRFIKEATEATSIQAVSQVEQNH